MDSFLLRRSPHKKLYFVVRRLVLNRHNYNKIINQCSYKYFVV